MSNDIMDVSMIVSSDVMCAFPNFKQPFASDADYGAEKLRKRTPELIAYWNNIAYIATNTFRACLQHLPGATELPWSNSSAIGHRNLSHAIVLFVMRHVQIHLVEGRCGELFDKTIENRRLETLRSLLPPPLSAMTKEVGWSVSSAYEDSVDLQTWHRNIPNCTCKIHENGFDWKKGSLLWVNKSYDVDTLEGSNAS